VRNLFRYSRARTAIFFDATRLRSTMCSSLIFCKIQSCYGTLEPQPIVCKRAHWGLVLKVTLAK